MNGKKYYSETLYRLEEDSNGKTYYKHTSKIFDVLGRVTKYRPEDFKDQDYVELRTKYGESIWLREPDMLHIELSLGILPEFDHLRVWYSEFSYRDEVHRADLRSKRSFPFNSTDVFCDFTIYDNLYNNIVALKNAGNKYAEELEIIYLVNRLTEEKIWEE